MSISKKNIVLAVILISAVLFMPVSCGIESTPSSSPFPGHSTTLAPITTDLSPVYPPDTASTDTACPTPVTSELTPGALPGSTIPDTEILPPNYRPDAYTDGFEMDATLGAGIRESENLPDDHILTRESLAQITSLYIWEQKILTLRGIEYLPNLEIFSTDLNDLISINEIESLSKLKQFRIGSGYVSTLPDMSKMSSLQELSITGNLISDITPISDAGSLTFVNLSVNRITSIAPLKDSHRLTALILDGNCITDYSTVSENKELVSAIEFSGHKYKDIIALENRAKEIVSTVIRSDMSGLEKEYTLYRYIIDHAEYSEAMRKNMPFGYYILMKGTGVCGDYAEALTLLCRHADLDMFCVSSDTHMWNMICLEGKYYHVDALWDEGNDIHSPVYFNRSTQFIQSVPDHSHDPARYPLAEDMPVSEYEYLFSNRGR